MRKIVKWTCGLALMWAAPLAAQTNVTIPPPIGVVNDFAHVLTPDAAAHIQKIAEDVRDKSRGEIAVVTMASIDDQDPAQVSLEIGRQWRVGKIGAPGDPTRNAGAVILLVPKETSADGRGHCFIATGSGAEGFITDADAGDMCRAVTPSFRAQDYSGGLEQLTYLTAQKFADEFHFTLDTSITNAQPAEQAPDVPHGGMSPFAFLLFIFVVFMVLSLLNRRAGGPRGCVGCLPLFIPFGGLGGGGRGWGRGGGWGGGGGGGFGGFGGGGGFSGGGGGSSW